METKELMLNDLVYAIVDGQKKIVKVRGIEFAKIRYQEGSKIYDCHHFEPISLTTEILEKIGFKKKMGGTFELVYNPRGTYIRLEYNPISGNISANDRWFIANEIHFFHELQHALRLCRIEKEIELNYENNERR